ncbi:ATP-binding protein [Pseudarthrobacter oxydans]|uniref:AAA family ATPase n=1 Tax=Pseudarthrobacter oxydans TaxID=1671 RepID=UPI003ECE29AA
MRNISTASVEATPVDIDSRLELVRHEVVHNEELSPVWEPSVGTTLRQIAAERRHPDRLQEVGLFPTRSALFTGPPGVGKTLAARWIARELDVPLLILDLAAVMSSFLGKTGSNLRKVMNYAKSHPCVLLLDELDAVAKRRDDESEIGELKRLVTVLLQEVDDWPTTGLLLAATNHPDLLDPAVWRRFEQVVEFPYPGQRAREIAVGKFLGESHMVPHELVVALGAVFAGSSFSDIERDLMTARRKTVFGNEKLEDVLIDLIRSHASKLSFGERRSIVTDIVTAGELSQRRASELFGISRDSLRKAALLKGEPRGINE